MQQNKALSSPSENFSSSRKTKNALKKQKAEQKSISKCDRSKNNNK